MVDVALLDVWRQKQRITGISAAQVYGWNLLWKLLPKYSSTLDNLTKSHTN